jgi:hypothetical protein
MCKQTYVSLERRERTAENSENRVFLKKIFEKLCLDRGSNRGPLDLQPNALPTELSGSSYKTMKSYLIYMMVNNMCNRWRGAPFDVTTSVCNNVTSNVVNIQTPFRQQHLVDYYINATSTVHK